MLPFLKNKKDAAVYVAPTTQQMGEPSPMKAAIRSLMQAIESKDEDAAEAAFQDCFQCCESQPHDEAGEPTDDSE